MLRLLIVVFSIGLLSGCATSSSVERLVAFTPKSKTLVLVNSTRWDNKLRVELSKKGFKILRFATTERVISEGGEGEIARVYDEAEARYGLTFSWDQVDRCVYNSSKLIDGYLEVSDISTNEVLLVLEAGGWTGPCADPRGNVFEKLGGLLSEAWRQ